MREDRERLLDILEAVESIQKKTATGPEAFHQDEMLQVWVIHHIQIIGEAAARLSNNLRTNYDKTPWRSIIEMRNVLVHHYFGVDLNEIWDTVINDLPPLKTDIETIQKEIP